MKSMKDTLDFLYGLSEICYYPDFPYFPAKECNVLALSDAN